MTRRVHAVSLLAAAVLCGPIYRWESEEGHSTIRLLMEPCRLAASPSETFAILRPDQKRHRRALRRPPGVCRLAHPPAPRPRTPAPPGAAAAPIRFRPVQHGSRESSPG